MAPWTLGRSMLRPLLFAVLLLVALPLLGRTAGAQTTSTSGKARASQQVCIQPQASIAVKVMTSGPATLVLVPVYVNGKGPFPFVLDTGSATSSIARSLAKKLGLQPSGWPSNAHGIGGSASAIPVKISNWKVGKTSLPAATVGALKLNSGQTSLGIAGLFGSDIMRQFKIVAVDYQHSRLVLGQ